MRRNTRRGMATVTVVLVLFLSLTFALALAGYAGSTLVRAEGERKALVAFQAAQAALENEVATAYDQVCTTRGTFQQSSRDVSSVIDSIAPGATATATVAPTSDESSAWITGTATFAGCTRSVRTLVDTRDVSIWNNAIFAGTGASGQSINGNVDIRGSMHLLGDGEAYSDLNGNGHWDAAESFTDNNGNGVWDPGEPFVDANNDGVWNSAEPYNDSNGNGVYDPPITTTDLNSTLGGTAYVGNHYSGMPAALRALVSDPPKVTGVETLNAEVRVKHGKIAISGSATMGSPSPVDGGLSKATLDGVFVNDGFAGNQGAASVFSDNGTTNQYDLGFLGFKFPLISGIGAEEYVDAGGAAWENQQLFLDTKALTVPITSITGSTPAFAYADTKGNSISFTPAVKSGKTVLSPPTIAVTGIVRIAGDLTIGASKEDLRYVGSGSIYSTGSISVHSNLLPAPGAIFPTTTRIGIIAKKNINLATGSGDAQLSMAGAFYAQGTIVSAKQNQIAGTFVANYFDMGTNVPNIYQTPSLVNHMPPGMPGDKAFFTLKTKSWRERQPKVTSR